jgi:hypothetical protein
LRRRVSLRAITVGSARITRAGLQTASVRAHLSRIVHSVPQPHFLTKNQHVRMVVIAGSVAERTA